MEMDSTALNAADEATSPTTIYQHEPESKWITGPTFLYEEENRWPQELLELVSEFCVMDEAVNRVMLTNKEEYPMQFSKFSKYLKMIRVLAWVLRFLHNSKSQTRRNGELDAKEIDNAEDKIICRVQNESFAEEIDALKRNKVTSKSSPLYQLTPFLDSDGLLKVNGRIDAAYCLPYTARRPTILPQNHYVTRLIVQQYHQKLHHQNDNLTKQNIEWVFNCPANPSAGDCWERLVQCVKRLLHRMLKEEAPRLETFRSVLIEAENIVNSRPLTDLAITPQDEEPLTPNHFLLGCLNSTQTPNPEEEKLCLRKQWRISQHLKDRLWKRWTVEYLPQLLRISKWREEAPPLQPGQLAIVFDPGKPRSQWERGRVTKVFTTKDGQVRSAQVRTSSGSIRRPARKLAALRVSESSSESTGGWNVISQH